MPHYIRAIVPNGTFSLTVALLERRRRGLTEHIGESRAAFTAGRSRKPFTMNAIVVLPGSSALIWTLPAGDADSSSCWQAIKSRFARAMRAGEQVSPRRRKTGKRGIWQRRFREHVIRDFNWNNAIGGMRCAFPPYELKPLRGDFSPIRA